MRFYFNFGLVVSYI